MAAEPLVKDPIAMAWGPDGRLWVVEMGDYPRGVDGRGGQGGVVRFLEDADGDGRYDRSTVFLDGLGFPNGVAPWRKGVLITCSPDIIYAEDTDGDGRADKREVLYHGFTQGNPQHRMNGLKWGFDGWLYGAHGDAVDGKIELRRAGGTANANGRDFRIRPDEGLLDPQSGTAQFGRNRDDWGNWFGNTNSDPMFQYVLDDDYLRRNEHVAAIDGRDQVSENPGAAEVFPRSRTLARFNDLYAANRFTSCNSTIVYRDDLFGPAFEGNAFMSEPVHNLVHREIMRPDGLTFTSRRADDEKQSEFLASADNWFRPTMLAAGPDGALWVADMYRQTIEHPEWIPLETQQKLDLRAGADKGRIYRVYPVGKRPRKIPRLDNLSTAQLVAALDTTGGWQRDMAQQLLVWRGDKSALVPLETLAAGSTRPECRLQALWTLELLGGLKSEAIARGLADPHPGVRRQAIRLSESHLAEAPQLGPRILAMVDDADLPVQLQRAYTLGQWRDERAGTALGQMALRFADNRFMVAALLSSITADNLHAVLAAVLSPGEGNQPPAEILEQLIALGIAYGDDRALAGALEKIGRPHDGKYADWQLTALAGLLDALGAPARPGRSTTRPKTWPRCSASPARPWPMPRRPRTSACGPCDCWAVAPANSPATSRRSWRCSCRSRRVPCKLPPSRPSRGSIPSRCPRPCWPVGRATGPRCDRKSSTCCSAARPGPRCYWRPSSARNSRPATSTPRVGSGSRNRPTSAFAARLPGCWPRRSIRIAARSSKPTPRC